MTKEEIDNVDAYFCQSFGLRKDGPGTSNEFLANFIVEIYNKIPKKLIIQEDAAIAFPKEIKINKIISKHSKPEKYLDTYEVSRQCAKYCKEYGIKKLLVFAHPDHIWRVARSIEKFGIETISVKLKSMPYDPESSQVWTRSRRAFLPRELIVRIYYFLTGKI